MIKLLHKLDFDNAGYDDTSKAVLIPFELKVGNFKAKAYLHIPASKEWHLAYIEGLREELRKDG